MACAKVVSDFELLAVEDAGRRRTWTDEDKVRIVEESLRGHRQGSATARRYLGSPDGWGLEAKFEIVLANGRRVIFPASIAPTVLARLLPVLEGA